MSGVYNLSAGPAVLSGDVLEEATAEMLSCRGAEMLAMEMSHRPKVYDAIVKDAKPNLRDLLHILNNCKVLFPQGGASQQFAMVPMNLMKNKMVDYIVTGQWAKKAHQEGGIYGRANAIASSANKTFSYIPDYSDLDISEDADYVYIYENNTIYRAEFWTLPNTKRKTLVADQPSCFLSEPVNVTKYGLIFADAREDVEPTGTVIVIVREGLVSEDVFEGTPTMPRYKTRVDAESLYSTPPTHGTYMYGKVFKQPGAKGGLEAMKKYNEKGTGILYDFLGQSRMFKGTTEKKDRFLMNVPLVMGSGGLDALFARESKAVGFESLKGHRTVGGMRAGTYNAIPMEGIGRLVAFVVDFEEKHSDML